MYGYLRGLLKIKSCPVKISIKVAQSDKTQMVNDLRSAEEAAAQRRQAAAQTPPDPVVHGEAEAANGSAPQEASASSLPPLVHKYEPGAPGWIEFDKPVLYMYAGKGPLVARDLLQFPMSLPDDGYVDVVIQERVSASR